MYSITSIAKKIYDMMKFRGLPYDKDMPSSMFLFMHSQLVHDSNKNGLDPFLFKVLAKHPDAR